MSERPSTRSVALSAVQIAQLLGQHPPTDEQRQVIEAPLAPSLVVAGAGSGKTETMAGRVVWLVANGLVTPDQVLGLTFTRKAAGELAERVRRRLRALVRAAAVQGVDLPGAADLADELARPQVSTYHAYAGSLVSEHALRAGIEPGARLLGEAAQWQLASEVVEQWAGDLDTAAATSTVVEAVLSLSGALDEHLLDPAGARAAIDDLVAAMDATPPGTPPRAPYAKVRDLRSSLGERSRVLELVAAYRARKRAADSLDFGDQVAIAARIARDVPEVGAGERTRCRVVLLDEYQDTSYAQLALLSALFGGGHPVTAVGDPHQSIYGWRGASAGGLARFPDTFPAVGPDGDRRRAEVVQLSTSWRNDHAVLDAANRVAAPLRGDGRVDVPELRARPGAGAGVVQARVDATVEDEARGVAQLVAAHWRPGTHPDGRRTAAVLCRKRSQFEPLRRALRAEGLPVEVVGLGGLLAAPEVVDLVAVLQAAHDPTRGDALVRLLTGARTRLGARDLHALGDWARHLARLSAPRSADPGDPADLPGAEAGTGQVVVEGDVVDASSLVDALDDLPPAGWVSGAGRRLTPQGRGRLADLAAVLRAVRRQAGLSLPELVGEAERLFGLDIEVQSRSDVTPARARAHLDAFRDVAVEFARAADRPTIGAFLAWLEAAEQREDGLDLPVTEPDPDAVQLMTVHASKGLEWDVVVVTGLVDGGLPATAVLGKDGPLDSGWLTGLGVLPYPLRGDRDDLPTLDLAGAADPKELAERLVRFRQDAGEHEVAEERRLAYVALTRARERLLLSAARWGDAKTPRRVSPFLAELVEHGLAEVLAWADEPEPGADNPRTGDVETAVWPADPFAVDGAAPRRPAVEAAADAVRDVLRAVRATAGAERRPAGPGTADAGHEGVPDGPDAPPPTDWDALADRLLAEQLERRTGNQQVDLPAHLSASALVRLDADPAAFALQLRRPVPREPSRQARRGTAFHAWVEAYYGRTTLVDLDLLPGADDDSEPVDADQDALRAAFLATPWADRTPIAVEVDVETTIGGHVLRSRIDAVFRDPEGPEGSVVVVDWKTGAPPTDPAQEASRDLQLAVYRLAWSRWTGTPVEHVAAAFCYVGAGVTVRPRRLLDADEIAVLLEAATRAPGPSQEPAAQ
ncbi:ATP-dependent helicase [Cellulomonas oligotrophica]|uniref:DNA 3'-5' helicase n=1 Tax=Cellulomonas oligotrophica TaxID=931536 RepID=A0A7Y9JW49_9CELL|nr:ATP-dependent DNA helicase [Cellulomonas oligotrophica]NYD85353.1 DNA helicase-2/ATP-dependent DNA helicase PcrA [Cellulomonas oligotrophica]GIG33212.1 ATP-dependent DNA helicase [Cellulomonas oligotrophica]